MFNFRLAEETDVESVVRLAGLFHATTDISKHIPFDEDTVTALFFRLLDEGCVVVCEDKFHEVIGCIGMLFHPSLMNGHYMQASELMWYMDKECRGNRAALTLQKCAEECARLEGCDVVTMVKLETSPEGVDAFYRRQGYQRSESTYVKGM